MFYEYNYTKSTNFFLCIKKNSYSGISPTSKEAESFKNTLNRKAFQKFYDKYDTNIEVFKFSLLGQNYRGVKMLFVDENSTIEPKSKFKKIINKFVSLLLGKKDFFKDYKTKGEITFIQASPPIDVYDRVNIITQLMNASYSGLSKLVKDSCSQNERVRYLPTAYLARRKNISSCNVTVDIPQHKLDLSSSNVPITKSVEDCNNSISVANKKEIKTDITTQKEDSINEVSNTNAKRRNIDKSNENLVVKSDKSVKNYNIDDVLSLIKNDSNPFIYNTLLEDGRALLFHIVELNPKLNEMEKYKRIIESLESSRTVNYNVLDIDGKTSFLSFVIKNEKFDFLKMMKGSNIIYEEQFEDLLKNTNNESLKENLLEINFVYPTLIKAIREKDLQDFSTQENFLHSLLYNPENSGKFLQQALFETKDYDFMIDFLLKYSIYLPKGTSKKIQEFAK